MHAEVPSGRDSFAFFAWLARSSSVATAGRFVDSLALLVTLWLLRRLVTGRRDKNPPDVRRYGHTAEGVVLYYALGTGTSLSPGTAGENRAPGVRLIFLIRQVVRAVYTAREIDRVSRLFLNC